MTARSWVRELFARPPRPARPAAARCRPRVEALEDRLVPAPIAVTTLLDNVDATDGDTSLREAIAQANGTDAADEITFSVTGTITLGGTQLPEITEDLTITGPGAASLTIDANHLSSVLQIARGTTVGLSGLTVANSNSAGSGAIFNLGTLTVTGSTLSGNSAGIGGGIWNEGTLTVTGSTLTGKSASHIGGGIFNRGTLTVTGSTLSGNSAGTAGGGIFTDGFTLTVTGSTLSGNSAGSGGGILSRDPLTVTGSTLSGNSAGTTGGGIDCSSDSATVVNSTLTGNVADAGGGIWTSNDPFTSTTLHNTIVAGNLRGTPEAGNPDDLAGKNVVAASSHNLIGKGGSGGLTDGVDGNQVGVAVAAVLDPDLKDNGGPTKTHALLADGPAIDAGDNDRVPADTLDLDGDGNTAEPVPFDQRGSGFARIRGGTVDIGAVEVQNQAPTVSSFTKVGAEDNTLAFTAADFTANYSDDDLDALAEVRIESLPATASGILKLNGVAVAAGQDIAAADLGRLTFEPGRNVSGRVTFRYTASDGVAFTASSATITLDIRSAAQQAADLRAMVNALGLKKTQAGTLLADLDLKGNTGDAGKVQSFLNDVEGYRKSRVLTQAQADELTRLGNILLLSVTRR